MGVADRELLRTLRLHALQDVPSAFGSTYEREATFGDDEWERRLATEHNSLFLATDGAGQPIGLAGGVRAGPNARAGDLVAMWVDPVARGTGIAGELVEAVVDWAERSGVTQLTLHVTDGNGRAEALYRRHGFRRTGAQFVRDRDGLTEVELARTLDGRR